MAAGTTHMFRAGRHQLLTATARGRDGSTTHTLWGLGRLSCRHKPHATSLATYPQRREHTPPLHTTNQTPHTRETRGASPSPQLTLHIAAHQADFQARGGQWRLHLAQQAAHGLCTAARGSAGCQHVCGMSMRVQNVSTWRNVNAGAECQCRCGVSIRVQMMPHTLLAGCRLREPRSHGQQTAVRGGGPPRPLTEGTGGVLSFSCLFSSPASLSTCTGGPRGGSSGGAQGGRLSERNLRQKHRLHTPDTLLSNVDACGCIWDARQGCCTLCSLGSNAKEAQGERVLMGPEGS